MALELPKLGNKQNKDNAAPKTDVTLKVMEFFDKNPFMKILIPVVLFVILLAVFLFVIFGDGIIIDDDAVVDNSAATNQVEVLPDNNIIKDKTIVDLIENDPLSEDILASAVYKGCVTGSSGLKTASVSIGAEGDTLVLTLGETVGDSDWEVIEITSDYVVLKAGEITKTLKAK